MNEVWKAAEWYLSDEYRVFTGIVHWTDLDSGPMLYYVKMGNIHRDDGPAVVVWERGNRSNEFYLDNGFCTEEYFWQQAYKKYKGTDREAEMLANMLGSK